MFAQGERRRRGTRNRRGVPTKYVAWLVVLAILDFSHASAAELIYPTDVWPVRPPAAAALDDAQLAAARDYGLSGGGSGLVVHRGYAVMTWGDQQARYDLKSTTKSIGATALGVALFDGKLALTDRAVDRHPTFAVPPKENRNSPWRAGVTLSHLATHTAGFEKPGGYTKLSFEPGTHWAYSDGGPNWLAECVTLAYRRDVAELMFQRIFTPLGIDGDDLRWRANSYREKTLDGIPRREFGSGVSANVDAMARLGYLYLRRGQWNGRRLLSEEFIRQASTTPPELKGLAEVAGDPHGNASEHYGLLWWNNNDGALTGVPRDAFWSWGLFDSLIVVIPSLDLVAARAGQSWDRKPGSDHYVVLAPFLRPLAAAAGFNDEDRPATATVTQAARPAPYPPSPVIAGLDWAPAASIVRRARGCDNWPLTWADDDLMYGAYGDGNGFEPRLKQKLSLGLATIRGGPDHFTGVNVRSDTLEAVGDDVRGRKASGIVMIDGVLYLLARNTGNAQLAWSEDHGRTWTWVDWKFTESFGCPTILNFGKNYSGARDEFVYIYSPDENSAYRRADRMVLARVPKTKLRDRAAYEFFTALNSGGEPQWSTDIARRGAVFEDPGRCYRGGVTYCAPLKRYLWVQSGLGHDLPHAGGLGIYDAPEPWGPWTTVFQTDLWDVAPGDTSSFPTKWMSADGKTLHLVSAGEDAFSVRRATLKVHGDDEKSGN
jgi:CubicO group peptidase (beta-lactamase class C family)